MQLINGYLHPLATGTDKLATTWRRACETVAQAVGRQPETSSDPEIPEVRKRVICRHCDCDRQYLEKAENDDAIYLGLIAKAIDMYEIF